MKQDISQSVDEAGRGNRALARFPLSEAVGGIAGVQAEFSHTADNSGLFCIYVLDTGRIGGAVSFFRGNHLGIPSAVRDGTIYNFLSKRLFRISLKHWYSLNMPICSDWAAEV